MAQAGAEAAPAGDRRRRVSPRRAPGDRLRRRLGAARAPARATATCSEAARVRSARAEAGRDPATVPITVFGVAEDRDLIKRYRDAGVAAARLQPAGREVRRGAPGARSLRRSHAAGAADGHRQARLQADRVWAALSRGADGHGRRLGRPGGDRAWHPLARAARRQGPGDRQPRGRPERGGDGAGRQDLRHQQRRVQVHGAAGQLFPVARPTTTPPAASRSSIPRPARSTPSTTAARAERLRGPNDLVFDGAGGFWFTDHGKTRERDSDRGVVYYAKADGSMIREAIFPLERPNGIGLSPDEKPLYVAETPTAAAGRSALGRADEPGTARIAARRARWWSASPATRCRLARGRRGGPRLRGHPHHRRGDRHLAGRQPVDQYMLRTPGHQRLLRRKDLRTAYVDALDGRHARSFEWPRPRSLPAFRHLIRSSSPTTRWARPRSAGRWRSAASSRSGRPSTRISPYRAAPPSRRAASCPRSTTT